MFECRSRCGFALLLLPAVIAMGCGASKVAEATAPLAATGDQADRACQVVLTALAPREIGAPGNYMTDCDLGDGTACLGRIVWFAEGTLAPSVVADGGAPALLYRSTDDSGSWIEAPATIETTDGAPRFAAHMLALHRGPDDGTQGAELIPFARFAAGRLFDHNAYAGPFENYRIGTPPPGTVRTTDSAFATRWGYQRPPACAVTAF
jgi:hypothetical protein